MFESLWCDPWIQPIRIQNRKADGEEESRKFSNVDQFDEKNRQNKKTVKNIAQKTTLCKSL
jgi:hypothetical protein